MFTRRRLLQGTLWAAVSSAVTGKLKGAPTTGQTRSELINRQAVVSRHNVKRTRSSPRSPLQVGNGNFAFDADVTGLQTFVPFNILSQWGWHTAPLPRGETLADMADEIWPAPGRGVPYDSGDKNHPRITEWAFSNPSRMNLGRIGLTLTKADGTTARDRDLTDTHQELDLWTGTLRSQFKLDGQTVVVTTASHPQHDAVAVRIESALLTTGKISAYLDFPAPDARQFADYVGSYSHSGRIPTKVIAQTPGRIDLSRQADDDVYYISVLHNGVKLIRPDEKGADEDPQRKIEIVRARYGADGADAKWLDVTRQVAEHIKAGTDVVVSNDALGPDPAPKHIKQLEVTYRLNGVEQTEHVRENGLWYPSDFGGPNCFRLAATADTLEFAVQFSPRPITNELPDASSTLAAAAKHWPEFWNTGGAIDLSASADARWMELERRIVLSQYLTAVNSAGDWPPQESGLVNNGWFGKFHMEMYWWHAAHFALWNRWPLLNRSSDVYSRMLDSAKVRAKTQGFKGARWTKMTGPDGRNAAFVTNALLAWQEPHPLFFAELEYRAFSTPETLNKWKTVLFEAADFMASFVTWNEQTKKFDMGPSMALVSENTDDKVTRNPTFELSYWRFGLRIAQTWRERLGMSRNSDWDHVLNNLAPLPVADGVYVTYENIPDMWTHYNFEHPALIGAYGWLPGDGVDAATMNATFDHVLASWKMNKVWGWDLAMLTMCAARLGRPEKAIDLLLTPSDQFGFDDAGLATGGPFPYFPSNGGFLYTVAMLAAGWDGSPDGKTAPGFPPGKQWVIKSEGLSRAI